MTITLTKMARIAISKNMMAKTGLSAKDIKMAIGIDNKIAVPEAEIKEMHVDSCPVCQQPVGFDKKMAIAGEPKSVDLESSEIRFLKELLDELIKGITPQLYKDWYGEALAKFEEAVKAIDSPTTA
jgi:hypothetical protein